ncbi:prepilin peptidase [Stutzerimonas kirkiae]|uniref:Prepilin leader peptidase/N-methyltransferase n=1 Tax=Stutzerimonas kirkiae TaxID=2211392 RepID=A0A4V2KC09_9GAMM|nr:A24 family peptidase [Stutzerimonas kirkiae]TBU90669.1 prepilin peptidase [Stutzerimonas kirkiae]TBV00181.1 prepilin peptidase [Stutzerimonas kirkiae]TBV04794.1 prepilin peptidase [Stutzerimonas kirkiae]TBV14040.1 prepilin peptidase [Stutzerimonas kirkiae]
MILELLAGNALVFVSCTAVLGLLVGSFLNVVVHRLPIMMQREWLSQAREFLSLPGSDDDGGPFNLMLPRSRCPHCEHVIRSWENIPLISWLVLRGRCSACKAPISCRYPLLELSCALISAFVAWHYGFSWQAGAMLLLSWGLLAMSLIDAEHQLLPDALVFPLLWLGLIANSFGVFCTLHDALWGAVLGYSSLWAVYWLFRLTTGKEGMGYGDFKLLAMLGAWGGWQILPVTILLSALSGALIGSIMLRLRKADMVTPIPFGPYLAFAGWVAMVWGERINALYLSTAGL